MSVIRTFTVTVANPGAGNRYYIDGNLQETVNLAEGYTYRFDQSDNTNGGHPFKFSTTSNGTHSGGSEYTTGVTYNGTPGDAGAYTQIVVAASAPQLYYYCQYHSGMGGQANTEPSDTWGLLQWNQNAWGSQDIVEVSLSGLSATSSLGTVLPFNETGWGRDTWGFENWGESAIDVTLPALSATTSLNIPTDFISLKPGWGTLDWGENGWGTVESAVFNLTGLSATTTVGALTPDDMALGLTGLSLDADLGVIISKSDVALTLTGIGLQSSPGLLSVDDHSVGLTGLEAETTLGITTPVAETIAALTGLDLEVDTGAIAISSNPALVLPGLSAQTALGGLTIDSVVVGLSGLSTQTALGATTTTQLSIASLVGLGQTATTTLNDAGISLRYYQRLTPKDSTGYSRKVPKDSTGYTRKTA